MDENSQVLSQDAIDELLESQASGETVDDDAPNPGAASANADETGDAEVAELDATAEPSESEDDSSDEEDSEIPEDVVADSPAANEPDSDEKDTQESGQPDSVPSDEAAEAAEDQKPSQSEPVVEILSESQEETTEPAAAPPTPPPVMVNAPPPPGVTPPPGVVHKEMPKTEESGTGITEEQARVVAQEAAQTAMESSKAELGAVSGRLNALEAAIAKIQVLEKEVSRLKAEKVTSASDIDLETLRPLVERLLALEKGAKNSPLFNLYEKFTCASCSHTGSAQARARCGSCGKEGWFGRKDAA